MSARRRLLGASLLCIVCAACGKADRDLTWVVLFGPGVDTTRAVRVETRIYAGGCGGEERYFSVVEPLSPVGALPPVLPPGDYAFEAVALDDECIAYATACVERTLPLIDGGRVQVQLESAPGVRRCPIEQCARGVCESGTSDGGIRDATMDGMRTDSGPPDADAAMDTGPDAPTSCSASDSTMGTGCPTGQHCSIDDAVMDAFVCVPDGPGTQATLCSDQSACAPGYGCMVSNYDGSPPKTCRHFCTGDGDCSGSGSTCSTDFGPGLCTTSCDPTSPGVCPAGMKCNIYDPDGHTYCSGSGRGLDGDPCGDDFDCQIGFGCYAYGTGDFYCYMFCDSRAPACPGPLSCVDLSPPWGICD